MKYNTEKLQDAFNRNAPDGKSWTLEKIALASGVGLATTFRVIRKGLGHKDSADAIARVLGFRNGRLDVQLAERRQARKAS